MTDGTILSTLGSIIYKFKQGVDTNWKVFYDGSSKKFNEITRIAVNNDMTRIAVVATSKK